MFGATPAETQATIQVRNRQRTVPVNLNALQISAERALRLCRQVHTSKTTPLRKLSEIFVVLISDRPMVALHRQFLNESRPTDVITFEHGEIFISTETARRHARRFGTSLLEEIQLYIIHGLLHLHGFDDRADTDARRMKAVQKRIFAATLRQAPYRRRVV